jgi:hypothetical protein
LPSALAHSFGPEIGTASFSIAGEQTKTVKVNIDAAGRASYLRAICLEDPAAPPRE